MYALDSLTIDRFRGLRDLTLTGLGRINLLVGRNNSGKTSLLEAISLYCNPLDQFAWLHTAQRRELGDSRLSRSESLAWLFPRAPGDDLLNLPKIHIQGDGRYAGGAVSAHFKQIEGLGVDLKSEFSRERRVFIRRIYQPEEVVKGAELRITVMQPDGMRHPLRFSVWDSLPMTREQASSTLSLPWSRRCLIASRLRRCST